MLAEWIVRLRALIGRRRHEAELDEELRYHLDREAERNRERGMSDSAARAAAARAFGNVTEVQETVRTGWGWRWLDELRQDVRFAQRNLRRELVLVGTVVVAIGLGVGLSTAYFTLFNAYFFKPFAVTDPGSLYEIRWNSKDRNGHGFSWQQYRDLRQLSVIRESFGYRGILARIERRPIAGVLVTGNYFRMLGVGPALGRVLAPMDARSVVLSHRSWEVRFGKDPTVIGRTMVVGGHGLEIVGVAQAGFAGVEENQPEFWAPIELASLLEPGLEHFATEPRELVNVVARFRPGSSTIAAKAAVLHWLEQATADRLESGRVVGVNLRSRATAQQLSPDVLRVLAPTLLVFGLVLLAACANVACAMVARGTARQRELGIRLALGAGRGRVVRQLMTESVLLAVPAAVAGLLVSRVALAGASRLMAVTMPEAFQPFVALAPLDADYRVLLFAVVVALLCAVLFGLLPAFQSTRPEIVRAARDDSGLGVRSSRLRQGLVIGQVTIATLLLIAAGVLLRGRERTQRRDLGFDPAGVVALDLDEGFRATTLQRFQQTPALHGLAATTQIPLEGLASRAAITADGPTAVLAPSLAVSEQFFDVLSIPLRAGRRFTEDDGRTNAPIAIVNEALAALLWRGGAALDRSMLLKPGIAGLVANPVLPEAGRSVRVVGVVQDAVTGWIGDAVHRPVVYLPLALNAPGARILVRADSQSRKTKALVEQTLAAVDPTAIAQLHTFDETVAFSIWPVRAAYWFALLVGGVALLLTLTGVYGALAFVVARRTREIGIRTALGASRANVISLIFGESVKLAWIGIAVGALMAAVLGRIVASRLETIDAFEPLAYLGGGAVVLLACALGAVLPSLRASRVEPLEALRTD